MAEPPPPCPPVHAGPPPPLGERVLTLEVPATWECHALALDLLVSEARERALVAPDDEDAAAHALHEALANALEHGARGEGAIAVGLWLDGARWAVTIEAGAGFPASAIPDPAQQHLFARGRGIRIMQALCHEVAFHRGGACAVLRWSRRGRAQRRSG